MHVYSPPLRAIGYYEIAGGLLQRIPGPPDQPSPESPWLLAAVGGEDLGQLDQDAVPAGVIALAAERGATRGLGVRRPVAGRTVEAEVIAQRGARVLGAKAPTGLQ